MYKALWDDVRGIAQRQALFYFPEVYFLQRLGQRENNKGRYSLLSTKNETKGRSEIIVL